MSKGIKLETSNDLKKACDNNKYILILKRPQSKSRIHVGTCRLLVFWHLLDYNDTTNRKLGTGKAKQQYFRFDSLEDAKNEYPAHVRMIDPCCQFCIKKTDF